MAAAAAAWLDALEPAQRAVATGGAPSADAESDAERRRWFYTPTDHGGLTLGAQRPAQQRLAYQLVASGLSVAGYNTVATIVGLDNVLDQVEGWRVDWGRERGRDPRMYYLRVFGEPGGAAPWGWRFGGHHVSLNNLVVDGAVRATTPCFFGADPASSPLLGPAPLRPLAGAEDLARELVRSLDPDQAARAVLLDRAPSDIVGGNRSELSDGDQLIHLRDIWRGQFADPGLLDLVTRMGDGAEQASGYDAADHQKVALSLSPKGLPASGLGAGQRDLLRALLATYLRRVPDGLAPALDDAALDSVHLAWAGPTEAGAPHYYRLQGPRLLIEYDNTQRQANHAHSVWRDPAADFGYDVLGAHLTAHHLRHAQAGAMRWFRPEVGSAIRRPRSGCIRPALTCSVRCRAAARQKRPAAGRRQDMSTKASAPPLVVRTGVGERSLAAGRAYLVGRDPQADVVIADGRVSWHHAELRAQNGRWALVDLGSSNGSYADGQQADLIEIDGIRQVRLGDPEDGRCSTACCSPARLPTARRIGRVPDNDIVVPHVSVSRHHAELRTTPGGYRIVDLGSHNGTFVNEQRVTEAALAEGDSVGFGDTTFRLAGGELLQIASPAEAQMPPAPDPMAETAIGAAPGGFGGRAVLPRGVRGDGSPRKESGGVLGGSPPRRQAQRRPRSRTRCAGWCRAASGSRTSTS